MTEQRLFSDPLDGPEPEPEPESEYSTRELSQFLRFYNEKIRKHSTAETRGVIRQIQRLLKKGVTVEMIRAALQNYAADEWRKAQDPRYSKHIRSFFTQEFIQEWQAPRPRVNRLNKPALEGLADLDRVMGVE